MAMSTPTVVVLDGSFNKISKYYADRENREELKGIKTALDRLEGANTFDIYAESEN